jgi:predicted RND superfamily exporter protein
MIEALFQRLRPVIHTVVRHPGLVLGLAFALSVIGVLLVMRLRIDTDFAKLIPKSYPSVQALERLREVVGGESTVDVAIISPSFEANRRFAEALIPRALALQGKGYAEPYLGRVEYRRETEFLRKNALYFATNDELDRLAQYLQDKIEEARLRLNPFFFELEDEEPEDTTAAALQVVYEELVGKEYPISDDSTTLVVRFYPTQSQTNIGYIEDLYRDLERLVVDLQPAHYHPEMQVVLAGRLLRQLVEVRAITNDVFSSFGAGVTAVLLMVVLYFSYKSYRARVGRHFNRRLLLSELGRMPVMAVLIGLPLLMSLSWSFGLAYIAFKTLNLMTSTLGLVLFGLGIDYGIHFYARYAEERAEGRSVAEAAEVTFLSTGQAITVGALTTAVALYVLVLADFKGFSEFGFIAGSGILFALMAMLTVMPALLVLAERYRLLNLDADHTAPAHRIAPGRFPGAPPILIGSVTAVVLALIFLPRVSFEWDFGKLEPRYADYEARQDYVERVYQTHGRRNPAYIVVDDPAEVPAVVAVLKERAAQDTLSPTILAVESLQERFPIMPEAQQVKLARIAQIRSLLEDPFLRTDTSAEMQRLREAAQTQRPISIEEVPEFLKERFTSKTGEVGNFVLIYPSVRLADGRNSIAFAEDVGQVEVNGKVYYAGSTSLVAADMLRLMLQEAPWMVLFTFTAVVVLMWLNFRTLHWTLLALLPLVVGVLWMLLAMELLGLKLNFYNMVVLPAVLGIGNDAGAHLVHRYRECGLGSIRQVLRSTGEAVTMASLTTMMGFGGQLLSFHPGLHSIGELAVVGIGTTLLAALLFLPALLQWLEDRTARVTAMSSAAVADK